MNTIGYLAYALMAGIILGALYFGGLWVTVNRLPKARHPALLVLLSYFLRIALLMGGFYLVMDENWLPLTVCVAGFLAMRYLAVRRLAVPGG